MRRDIVVDSRLGLKLTPRGLSPQVAAQCQQSPRRRHSNAPRRICAPGGRALTVTVDKPNPLTRRRHRRCRLVIVFRAAAVSICLYGVVSSNCRLL